MKIVNTTFGFHGKIPRNFPIASGIPSIFPAVVLLEPRQVEKTTHVKNLNLDK
ncbi:hypothetical protein [Algoriphagus sp. Y33]|uniref:hypothetical protein n=1 Tax=Algoriphagus sp. Y33 TaxID=2772483 RepID=UPI00177A9D57|nr:hypothetical protein [Algoriphagus sp. Y33]